MVKFGPSGNSEKFYNDGNTSSEQAPLWLKNQGLDLYEYSFGKGILLSDKKAQLIGEKAKENNIEISVHAPYYINFANPSDEMVEKSYGYLLRSAEKARLMGAKRVVFHPAALGKAIRTDAVNLAKERLRIFADIVHEKGYTDILFCPETMGKINQIGTLEEVMEFCAIDDIFLPTIDFGHLNARTHGHMSSHDDFYEAFELMRKSLTQKQLNELHIHFSKIEYSNGGEVRHLTFADNVYGPEFLPLAELIDNYAPDARIICESDSTQSDDAVEMKKIYNELHIKQ